MTYSKIINIDSDINLRNNSSTYRCNVTPTYDTLEDFFCWTENMEC